MKNLFCIAGVFFVGFLAGAVWDSRQMANDEEYHDYWMKRSKNKTTTE